MEPPGGATTRGALTEALALQRAGRFAEAERLYLRILDGKPDDVDALHLLGVIHLQRRQFKDAGSRLARAAELAPRRADVLNHLGMAHKGGGDLAEAMACYRLAAEADPSYAEATYNLANVLNELDRLDEAETTYRSAITLQPTSQAYNNLGTLLWRRGHWAEALASLEKAVALEPRNADAQNNLGAVLKDRSRFDEAILCFERALALRPDFSDALHNLGNARRNMGDLDEAHAAYDRALAVRSDDLVARWSRLLSLPNLYDSEDEIEEWRSRWAAGLTELVETIRLDTPLRIAEAKRAILSQTNFNLHYQGHDDTELQRIYGALIHRIAAASAPDLVERPTAKPVGTTLRIGFVSTSFYRHTVGHLFGGWITGLDRGAFEVHIFHAGTNDDDLTKKLRQSADGFHQGFRGGDGLVAALRNASLDALIYPDIGMAPILQLPAALRLAPLQAVSWGHPVTSGLPTMDAFLTSDLMEPQDGDDHYSEQLVRLPNLSIRFAFPHAVKNMVLPVPGVSSRHPRYLCAQSLFKLLPHYDRLFARIARETGPCRMIFIRHPAAAVNDRFYARLKRAFRAEGLDADDFCEIHPRVDAAGFFMLNAGADVVLDSLFWSGGKTSLDAFACDRPVVTLAGPMMRGRHTAAMLTLMGVGDLIARDEDDYARIAVRLGRDHSWRREISEKIAANKYHLFDDREPVRALERFLLERSGRN
jgi:protein O-GlcNAc transferase